MLDTPEELAQLGSDLALHDRVRAGWGDLGEKAAEPVIFFRYGDRFRAYLFDAYLLAGLLRIEPRTFVLERVPEDYAFRCAIIEVHELLVYDACLAIERAGRSFVFFAGEAPVALLKELGAALTHENLPARPAEPGA